VIQFKLQNSNQISFTGSSQDEITFLDMCRDVGLCRFVERNSDEIKIEVQGKIEKYQIIKVVEFSSDRKRMSVIVKREDGQVINFIKGADIAIIPRISKSSDDAKNQDTIKQMDEFAS
jgi:phospholipid-translocating ATPase